LEIETLSIGGEVVGGDVYFDMNGEVVASNNVTVLEGGLLNLRHTDRKRNVTGDGVMIRTPLLLIELGGTVYIGEGQMVCSDRFEVQGTFELRRDTVSDRPASEQHVNRLKPIVITDLMGDYVQSATGSFGKFFFFFF
jgi:hypothetical protein